jgi:hypothetical protein
LKSFLDLIHIPLTILFVVVVFGIVLGLCNMARQKF